MELSELLKSRKYGGEEVLALPPEMNLMLMSMLGAYRDRYPKVLSRAETATTSSELKELCSATLDRMKEAVPLIEVLLGQKNRMPTKQEYQLAGIIFDEVGKAMKLIVPMIEQDEQVRGLLDVMFKVKGRTGAEQRRAMQSATGLFAKRLKTFRVERGGFKGAIREAAAIPGAALAGLGETAPTLPGGAGALGQVGLTALLGPFAPIAAMGITGARGAFRGIQGLLQARSMRREATEMGGAAVGLTAKELGVPEQALYPGKAAYEGGIGLPQYLGAGMKSVAGTGVMDWLLGRTKGVQAAGAGMPVGEGVLAGAVTTGLYRFFQKQAYQARWTKRVLELLGDRRGGAGGAGLSGAAAAGGLAGLAITTAKVLGAVTLGVALGLGTYLGLKTMFPGPKEKLDQYLTEQYTAAMKTPHMPFLGLLFPYDKFRNLATGALEAFKGSKTVSDYGDWRESQRVQRPLVEDKISPFRRWQLNTGFVVPKGPEEEAYVGMKVPGITPAIPEPRPLVPSGVMPSGISEEVMERLTKALEGLATVKKEEPKVSAPGRMTEGIGYDAKDVPLNILQQGIEVDQ